MRILVRIFLLLISVEAFSQKLPEIDALNRVILNHKDSIIYAHLLTEDQTQKINTSNDYWYYWYAQHDIKSTRGGYDGKLLDGEYTEYYKSKDLKQKGAFKKGLKAGEWKSWYKNGQLSEIVYYKKGSRDGRYTTYKEDGTISVSQRYRKGILVSSKKTIRDATGIQSKKNKRPNTKSSNPDQPEEELKKEKNKARKEPKVRVRRSIKIVPQPGKST